MAGYIGSKAVNLSTTGADINGDANINGDLSFRDNDKAIFGAGSDLQIYHNGSHSIIADVGTGNLNLYGENLNLQNSDGTENYIRATVNSDVKLYYDNAAKLATTSTGVDITGALTSDGLTAIAASANTDIAIFDGATGNGTRGLKISTEADNAADQVVVMSAQYDGAVDGYFKFKTADLERLRIDKQGDISFYEDTGTTAKFFWDASAESLGIGTSSPSQQLHLSGSTPIIRLTDTDTNAYGEISSSSSDGNLMFFADQGNTQANTTMRFYVDATERMRITSTGSVGIGTSSPSTTLHLASSGTALRLQDTDTNAYAEISTSDQGALILEADKGNSQASSTMLFKVDNTERMRIDSSGNLLVGKTSSDINTAGVAIFGEGLLRSSRSNGSPLQLNRISTDGDIAPFRKDGSTVGSIGTKNGALHIGSTKGSDSYLGFYSNQIIPTTSDGSDKDNAIDLGYSGSRFDDIYVLSVISTSDRNEKQDIGELSEAEQRVAVACKGLMRKFRWKNRVAEKGDDARIHFGIIAQDLQAAFAAEGLDAGDYAMFISSTWWETQTEVPAVEAVAEVTETTTDEDGNEVVTVVTEAVEAKDAYTRTDTYETQEEAPEGATERTRLGVRYSELLAFIIGAL